MVALDVRAVFVSLRGASRGPPGFAIGVDHLFYSLVPSHFTGNIAGNQHYSTGSRGASTAVHLVRQQQGGFSDGTIRIESLPLEYVLSRSGHHC